MKLISITLEEAEQVLVSCAKEICGECPYSITQTKTRTCIVYDNNGENPRVPCNFDSPIDYRKAFNKQIIVTKLKQI